MNSLPLATLSTDSDAEKYNKLVFRAYKPFQMLQVTKLTLMVNENGISNTILTDRATPVNMSINHPRHCKASKTSSENITTLFAMDSYEETGIPSQLLKDFIKETETTFPLFTDSYAETVTPSAC